MSSSDDDRATEDLTIESLRRDFDRIPPEQRRRVAGKLLAKYFNGRARIVETPEGLVGIIPPPEGGGDRSRSSP